MHRFFTDASCIAYDNITILGDDVLHITKVLRLKCGDDICICDGCGNDYICRISDIKKDAVLCNILSKHKSACESPLNITLYQGIPKADKMEYIIQKCVELGVNAFVPVETMRTVVKLKDSEKKRIRWQKIAEQAAKQSTRGIIPKVLPPSKYSDIIKKISDDENALNILAYENEQNLSIKSVLKQTNTTNINIIIGPEGGFDKTETELADKNNINIVTLGPRILRTETAPIAVSTAVMYELGDW